MIDIKVLFHFPIPYQWHTTPPKLSHNAYCIQSNENHFILLVGTNGIVMVNFEHKNCTSKNAFCIFFSLTLTEFSILFWMKLVGCWWWTASASVENCVFVSCTFNIQQLAGARSLPTTSVNSGVHLLQKNMTWSGAADIYTCNMHIAQIRALKCFRRAVE